MSLTFLGELLPSEESQWGRNGRGLAPADVWQPRNGCSQTRPVVHGLGPDIGRTLQGNHPILDSESQAYFLSVMGGNHRETLQASSSIICTCAELGLTVFFVMQEGAQNVSIKPHGMSCTGTSNKLLETN